MDLPAVGAFLRTRREALQPEDVGLRRGARRRAAGLRREEVAELAGMSSDYLARLERGAGTQPSEQMITALARALRLTVDERDHLLLLADHRPAPRGETDDHVNPGLLRILDSLTDTPAMVIGALGETLAQNAVAMALFGDPTPFTGPRKSSLYRWFTDPSSRSLYPPEDHEHHSRVRVSQVRQATVLLGHGSAATALAERLRAVSPEFAELWNANEVGLRYSEQKRFVHPEVGELSLFCQTVLEPEQHQSLLVLTATPGSLDAEKLRLLSVLGSYNISPAPTRAELPER
jgi:transcriptional regulator with XRE-family HTH domain